MLSIPKISQKLMLNMAENLRYIHPLRTRKWLAVLLVSELIDENKKAKKKNDVVKQERGFGVEAVRDAKTT